jgi:hypothetical protein
MATYFKTGHDHSKCPSTSWPTDSIYVHAYAISMTSLNKSTASCTLFICRQIMEDFQAYSILNRLRKEKKEDEGEKNRKWE